MRSQLWEGHSTKTYLRNLIWNSFKEKKVMGSGPAPFSDIGRRARDLLTKDYNYNKKFSISIPSSTGLGLTATGLKKDQFFVGDLSTQYKSGKTTVDVKFDTYSNVTTKVTYDVLPSTKAAVSFSIPDHKSDKLDVHYLHHHTTIHFSTGLYPSSLLEAAATVGSKDIAIGGEIGFDTSSSSFTKCNAGVSFNKPDFSAAVILEGKGKRVKACYAHVVNQLRDTEVGAEMTHSLSSFGNSFSIGCTHKLDPLTSIKTRFSDNGRLAISAQHQWSPKSVATFSAEYDSKALNMPPRFGLSIALKP